MKANEAPKKLYLHPTANGKVGASWLAFPSLTNEDVEYTRTDAFIDKACEWLYLQLNEINMEGEDMENFIKDFEKYMKGE